MKIVVLGATGQTGGATARALMGRAEVRVAVRSEEKGVAWTERGAEVAVVDDVADTDALARAFDGAAGAFVLIPPNYQTDDMTAYARKVASSIADAARRAHLPKIVALSSFGAHIPQGTGNILTVHILEETLKTLAGDTAVGFIRAGSFMENWKSLLPVAQEQGILPSFFAPLDRPLPTVAAADIGQTSADALLQDWQGVQVWELDGPQPLSPNDAAASFSRVLGRDVQAVLLPESDWPATLAQMGNSVAAAASYTEMLRTINDGTLVFENAGTLAVHGTTTLDDAVRSWRHGSPA